jgi:hypothetical protein
MKARCSLLLDPGQEVEMLFFLEVLIETQTVKNTFENLTFHGTKSFT